MASGRPRKRLITLVRDGSFNPYKHEHLLKTDDWFERNAPSFIKSARQDKDEHRLLLWMITLAILRIYRHRACPRDARRALAKAFEKATIEFDAEPFLELLEAGAPLDGWRFSASGPEPPVEHAA